MRGAVLVDGLDAGGAVHVDDGGMRSRHAGATSWTKSMYGLGRGPPEKISAARSASTIGATGRNCSLPLTSLRRSRFSLRPGWASRDR